MKLRWPEHLEFWGRLIWRAINIASTVFDHYFKRMFRIDHLSEDKYVGAKGWIVSIATARAVLAV